MGYGKKIYQAASQELEKRRQKAEQIAENKLHAFHTLCPRAEEINRQKASNAAKIVKTVLRGENVREGLEHLKENAAALDAEYASLLQTHGVLSDDILPPYACSKCADTGFVDGMMCSCLKDLQRQLAHKALSTNLPLEDSTFESFSLHYYTDEKVRKAMESTLAWCKKYAESFNSHSRSLLFKGATGLGKTHMSLAIANVAIDRGFGVIYGSTQSFAVAIERERFDRGGDELAETATQLSTCDLLILDDLGTEFPSAYVNAALYDIINTRLLAEKPTIINTNLSLSELEKTYSERFASRIVGNFDVFDFRGDDIRFQKRREELQ